jgi:hypothetical protein
MSVSSDLYRQLGPGQLTTFSVHQDTGISHKLVIARMAALRKQGRIKHIRDEYCDPSLGHYLVGVYERV